MTHRHARVCTIVLLLAAFLTTAAAASPRQETLEGPMTGEVLNVLDGDTINVKIHVWIGQEVETSLRINGIDAPEIHGKCEKERDMAEKAREEVVALTGTPVKIYNIRLEKYAGRVLAQVETGDGIDIAKHMIEKGLARPYHGEKRGAWCS